MNINKKNKPLSQFQITAFIFVNTTRIFVFIYKTQIYHKTCTTVNIIETRWRLTQSFFSIYFYYEIHHTKTKLMQ